MIYCGSLSKSLAPGLRLGFLVADTALINEARALRQEQRALVMDIVDANRDALGDVLDDARMAREEMRGRRFHHRGGPGFGRDG